MSKIAFGIFVAADDLPGPWLDALIAVEDPAFFDHPGVDFRSHSGARQIALSRSDARALRQAAAVRRPVSSLPSSSAGRYQAANPG